MGVPKALRWVGRGIVGILLLGVVAVLLLVAPVEHGTYEGTAYHRATRSRLEDLATARRAAPTGDLRCGFGRSVLTPTIGAAQDDAERGLFRAVPLAGYGDREGRPATGRVEELWVKAVAWECGGRTGVVVSADALIVPREVAEIALKRLEAETGLGLGQVYLGATHTHCGPGGWGQGWVAEAFAGGFVPGVREWMASRIVEAAKAALGDLTPSSAGSGVFEAPEFTRNRLVGDKGRIDPRFSLLVIQQDDGHRAVVGCYAAHATVLSGRMMDFCGDYPGYWQQAVEAATGGMAMFLAGAVGSHAPKPPEGGLAGAKAMGERLAERTVAAVNAVRLERRPAWDMQALEVDLPPLQWRLADGLKLREWAARRLFPVRPVTWLQYLRLGDFVWLSTPCDYSGELAMELADATRETGVKTAVTSFNGDYVGYVVPVRHYAMNTYETRIMSFFGPQLPGYFDALLKDLVRVAATDSATATGPAAGAPAVAAPAR
ncbi:MAG: neutral/alkaline non-lysosomal ceramidase N-terminal domain-containing protein [Verrucomicrobiales bacterium]|nr:neutral/alkaline non-lysosomal ceramidase N-terminal domain-containing protein [Verrucomicrobiales bacterium]